MLCACGPRFHGEVLSPPIPAPDLEGIDWSGELLRLSDLQGQVTLLFFGYTACPDVCPATFATLRRVQSDLGERADRLAVVLVSLDPERDDPETLARYVPAFDRRFHGLHMDRERLALVRRDYRIRVERRYPEGAAAGDYYLDHSSWLFAVDPSGKLRLRYPFGAEAEEIAADVRALLSEDVG